MIRLLIVLALLLCANHVHAQDSEVQQLKSQVQALQQLVMQLTNRVNKLEGALALQQAGKTTPQTTSRTSNNRSFPTITTTRKPTQKVEYTLEKVLPKMRVDGNHGFQIVGVTSRNDSNTDNEDTVTLKIQFINRANDDWDIYKDSLRFRSNTGELLATHGRVVSFSPAIKKGERSVRELSFKIKNPQPMLKGVLEISSTEHGTSVEFKVTLKRTETVVNKDS